MIQAVNEHFCLTLKFHPAIHFTDEQFYEFCRMNRELSIERNAEQEVLIMSPTGGETGYRNSYLITELMIWARRDRSGVVFDSSTGFVLPNRATRSPDAAWIRRSRLACLTPEQKRRFIPLCPDFVTELCSPSDTVSVLGEKMREYMENGALLGWLIVPNEKTVFVSRPGQETVCLKNPSAVSGDPVLPGFVLNLQEIWETGF
ncbi:MAG: Uma2 family endonuclease [Desulfobacterales bacterium]